jgi:hypothetical protein
MADVDMTDAPSGSSAPIKKAVVKAKAGGSAEGSADGKKRFEVKKVNKSFALVATRSTDSFIVERSCSLGLGYCS